MGLLTEFLERRWVTGTAVLEGAGQVPAAARAVAAPGVEAGGGAYFRLVRHSLPVSSRQMRSRRSSVVDSESVYTRSLGAATSTVAAWRRSATTRSMMLRTSLLASVTRDWREVLEAKLSSVERT